jgi:hypothetical protein
MKLEDALRSFDHVQFWTLDHSERVFSLCIYSSWVLDIPAYPWYYVKKGYGGVVFGLGGRYNLSSTSGTWTEEESRRPIHELEQLALLRTCEHLVPLGREIHAVVDNTTVCQCTLRRRSSNYWLNKGVGILLSNWRVVSASYITSEKNPADSLSRGLPLNVQLAVDAVLEFGQLGGSTNRVASDSTCCLCECV